MEKKWLKMTKQELFVLIRAGSIISETIIDIAIDGDYATLFFKDETKTNGVKAVDHDVLIEIKEILLRMERNGMKVL